MTKNRIDFLHKIGYTIVRLAFIDFILERHAFYEEK